ncbi:MAG: signal peptidase I [Clostridia bacterium]|nr:signal peptidase I [Clostridia bacterium]
MKQYSNKVQFNYSNILSSVLNAIYFIVIIIALIYLLFCNMYLVRMVDETSMQPLLNENGTDNDIVYVNKWYKEIAYGDIVVLEDEKSIIKRVLGLPGDTIDILPNPDKNNALMIYRNNEFIDEPYIKLDANQLDPTGMYKAHLNFNAYKSEHPEKLVEINGRLQYKLAENEIFLVGDNRHVSEDSIIKGAYDITKVIGIVDYIQQDNENNLGIMCDYIFTFEWLKSLLNLI